jgi:hypothetical protein
MSCLGCDLCIREINKKNISDIKKDTFNKSCMKGYYKLGIYYRDEECNYKVSLDMFKRGTILGCKRSLFNIGLSYLFGYGVEKNENISSFIFNKIPQILEGKHDEDMKEALKNDHTLQILLNSLRRNYKVKCIKKVFVKI